MDRGTVIRTALLVLALVNQILVIFGLSPLPIEDAQLEQVISLGFTVVTSLVAWWRNNYVSSRGKQQQEVLRQNGLTK